MEQGVTDESLSEESEEVDSQNFDTAVMTQKQVGKMYARNKSPKIRSTKKTIGKAANQMERFRTLSLDPKLVKT